MKTTANLATNSMIHKLDKTDKKMLYRFYKAQGYSASLMGYDTCYTIKNKHSEIIAAVIVSQLVQQNQQALLHGLVVSTEHRNKGLAKNLIKHCVHNHDTVVCFASRSLKDLYRRAGFSMLLNQQIEQHLNQLLITRFRIYQQKQPLLQVFIQR
ncbi:hypothetical protein BI291_05095 [Thalassotalea sp. PP2-459]|nr:hypothetical protein BI291_05095 [Thalassotalea sp. PP2-459]